MFCFICMSDAAMHSVVTLRPEWNSLHVADNIFKWIFFNENFCILIQISMRIVPNGSPANKSALAQVRICEKIFNLVLMAPHCIYQFFLSSCKSHEHDDVIKWKHFPRYWLFMRGIHQSVVNSITKASDAELWWFLWSAPWINNWVIMTSL